MKKTSNNFKTYFTRFFINYLLIIAIVSVSFIPIYFTTINSLKGSLSNDLKTTLNNQLLVINDQLNFLNHVSNSLRNNSSFKSLAQITPTTFSLHHYASLETAHSYMKDILHYPSLISNSCFIFKNNDILISPTLISTEYSKDYLTQLSFEGVSYEDFRRSINLSTTPHFMNPLTLVSNSLSSATTKTLVLPYIIPARNNMLYKNDSALLCFIDISSLKHLLLNSTQYTFVNLLNNEGTILYSFTNDTTYSEKDIMLIETDSLGTSFKLSAGFDKKSLFAPVRKTLSLIHLLFIASIILGICISLFLSYRHNKPIKRLLRSLAPFTPDLSSSEGLLDGVVLAIDKLSSQHKAYLLQIDQLNSSTRTNLFDKLLHGHLTPSDLENLNCHLPFLTQEFMLVIVNFSPTAPHIATLSDQELSILTASIFSNELPNLCYIHNVLPKQLILVIAPSQTYSSSLLATQLETLSQIIKTTLQYDCFCSVSEWGQSYYDVFSCYTQALSIVRLHYPNKAYGIIFYLPYQSDDCFIELKDTQKLYELILSGQLDNILCMLNELHQKLLLQSSVPNELLSRIYHSFQNAIIFAAKDLKLEDQYPAIFQEYSPYIKVNTLFDYLRSSCTTLCQLVQVNKKSKTTRALSDFKRIIDTCYMDPNLSVSYIATQLDLSEKYLCAYIKDHIGKSIGECLEEKRMTQAMLLLSDDKLIIKDIALSVGFNSQNTFYKAFKRYTGVSPGTWRNTRTTLAESPIVK